MAIEEPTIAVDSAPEPAEDKPTETKASRKSSRTKEAKEPKAKKAAAPKKPRAPPSHPPYEEMINDAIVTLKEKTGSSQDAITKFIEEKQKHLPRNFKKRLLSHLKKLVAAGKLVKVNNSIKLPSAKSSKPAATASARAMKKQSVSKARSKSSLKSKDVKSTKTASKAPANIKTASKTKAKPAAKPKLASKAKSTTTKTKAVATVKPKTTLSTKSKSVAKQKPAKTARSSSRTSPGKMQMPNVKANQSMLTPHSWGKLHGFPMNAEAVAHVGSNPQYMHPQSQFDDFYASHDLPLFDEHSHQSQPVYGRHASVGGHSSNVQAKPSMVTKNFMADAASYMQSPPCGSIIEYNPCPAHGPVYAYAFADAIRHVSDAPARDNGSVYGTIIPDNFRLGSSAIPMCT